MIQNICFQEYQIRGVENRSNAQWQNGTVAQFVTDSPTLHIVQDTFPEHARGRKHKAMSGSPSGYKDLLELVIQNSFCIMVIAMFKI